MTRIGLPAAALLTAVAAWLSQGILSLAVADGPRLALLPLSIATLGIVACVGVVAIVLARAGASLAPIWLLGLIVLPWIPLPLPAAFFIWAGSIRWLIWTAVALAMLATLAPARWRWLQALLPGLASLLHRRPRTAAGALAFAIFAFAAWQVAPSLPGGDEPHYLVITQSLLLDGDLKIENNHKRGDYRAYYGGTLAPHYLRRGADGEIYSIHAPGVSALVAPAFALGGYRAVVLGLLLMASCGSALAWHLAWLASGSRAGAWFGWAAVTLSATTIFHSFAVYPDGVGGVIVLTGIWALLRAEEERRTGAEQLLPWLLHGMALALLPWLHSRFAVLAGCLGALLLLRLSATRNPAGKAVAFLFVPAVSAVGWIAFFQSIYGVADPSAPYGTARDFSVAFIPGGLTGLLFDQRFGLIANAPVLVVGLAGLVMMLRLHRPEAVDQGPGLADRRLALELMFVAVPYLLTATTYAMWWAGSSAPARFASPAVLILAIPCAVAWTRIRHRGSRAVASGALALTAALSCVLVVTDGGRLAFNTRETPALWLEWASRLVPLADGLPLWLRGQEGGFARDVAVWGLALALAWWCTRALATHPSFVARGRLLTAMLAVHAALAMAAATCVWRLHGVDPWGAAAPTQLELLRGIALHERALTLQIDPPRTLATDRLVETMLLEPEMRSSAASRGRSDPTLAALPTLPAGRYRVQVEGGGRGGWLMIGIGQDQFALRSDALTWPAPPIEIEFPVDVRALIVRGDEDARRSVRRVVVSPLSIVPARGRLTDLVARRAVKYEGASVYFLDDRSFAEPGAFWVGGSRQSTFVVQPERRQASVTLHLRNAPVDNRLTLESGEWREELTLTPGEERVVTVPLAPGASAVIVTASTTSGFRPSETTPESRDDRFLGVWVRPGRE